MIKTTGTRLERQLEIAINALERIVLGKDICVSYEHDSRPTEQEVAKAAIREIANLK